MKAGEGHPRWPAWDGETFSGYLRRLAVNMGLVADDTPEPGRKMQSIDRRSTEERIDAIFDGARDPGEDG